MVLVGTITLSIIAYPIASPMSLTLFVSPPIDFTRLIGAGVYTCVQEPTPLRTLHSSTLHRGGRQRPTQVD
ncbi:hypothetical protein DER46DRAFT_615141 [Fusarium sp. MPI-SDFR-AT-0072]|nr:hypothetical protein DER46DRAFT_615141 [Fusarium sp. MPI-SDFR-AT-0072]